MRTLRRAQRETRAVGTRETASLSIAATHALSFTFFPGWVRKHIRLEALGTLNLISDSMEACEEIMLAGEVDFLLCHHHPDAPTRFDPDRFKSIAVGSDTLVPVSAPDAEGHPVWPLGADREKKTPLLAYSKASGLGRILAAHQLGEAPGLEAVFTSHHAATLMSMAREGHGVAWLPQTLINDDLVSARLVRAGPEGAAIAVEIRLFRSNDAQSSAANELWTLLIGSAGPSRH
jgi:DNA-binding transcriptional LysR family regulator